jgi:hypothetical protein
MRDTIAGRLLYKVIQRQIDKMTEGGNDDDPLSIMVKCIGKELPLRSMMMMNSRNLTYGMLDGVLMMINGRALRGMRKLLTEFWHTRDRNQTSIQNRILKSQGFRCSGKFDRPPEPASRRHRAVPRAFPVPRSAQSP